MKAVLAASAAAILITACAPTSQSKRVTDAPVQARTGPVCLLKGPMPANIRHTVVGEINASKETYGSVNEIIPLLGDEARKMGADVVINVTTAQRLGMFAWARPVASGTAVKVERPADFNCTKMGGEVR